MKRDDAGPRGLIKRQQALARLRIGARRALQQSKGKHMETKFIAASDATELQKRVQAGWAAASALTEIMMSALPPEKHESVERLLAAGGRVGVELTTSGQAQNRLCLVGVTPEGERFTLATVATIGATPQPAAVQ